MCRPFFPFNGRLRTDFINQFLENGLLSLERAKDLVDKFVGSDAPMTPLRIEVCCRVLGHYFTFGATRFDHALDTVTNSHDHVAKCLDGSAVCYFSSGRHHVESFVCPPVKRLQ
jgi:hypothetical protein